MKWAVKFSRFEPNEFNQPYIMFKWAQLNLICHRHKRSCILTKRSPGRKWGAAGFERISSAVVQAVSNQRIMYFTGHFCCAPRQPAGTSPQPAAQIGFSMVKHCAVVYRRSGITDYSYANLFGVFLSFPLGETGRITIYVAVTKAAAVFNIMAVYYP